MRRGQCMTQMPLLWAWQPVEGEEASISARGRTRAAAESTLTPSSLAPLLRFSGYGTGCALQVTRNSRGIMGTTDDTVLLQEGTCHLGTPYLTKVPPKYSILHASAVCDSAPGETEDTCLCRIMTTALQRVVSADGGIATSEQGTVRPDLR
ncbi:hypothetical protein J3F83DRAFT_352654 [Trichoderma novae-zelandiae]